jgi:hypothetical protein
MRSKQHWGFDGGNTLFPTGTGGSPVNIGAPLSSACNVVSDYRFLVSGKYLVFYRYASDFDSKDRADGIIYIIRVLYGSRNYLPVLFADIFEGDASDLYD